MSADLPTEDDVLAALLMRWLAIHQRRTAEPDVTMLWGVPLAVSVLVGHSWDVDDVEAAIADSERRLEAERARDAVLMAAEEWRDCATALTSDGLESAVDALRAAEGR